MVETDICMSTWEGYGRKDCKLDGHECILVSPRKPYPGSPWVWRAEFFGAFDYADRALLEKGWHVAYIGISDMYGCPEAVAIMEKFYRYMTEKVGLSRRVDLFGFSRGALYAVNFTVGRPEAVSTLYLDAPVLNVRSWPGGFGDAARFEKEWEECKQVYHISEEDASVFKGNPLDKLDQLLAGQVKIMLVAGGADTVVPYKENGKLLASYYEEHGGTIKVIVKPDCDHHPHSLEDPSPIVEYIMKNFG